MKASVKRAIIFSVVALAIAGVALILLLAVDISGGSETVQQGQEDQDDGGQQAGGTDGDEVKLDLRPCILAKADIAWDEVSTKEAYLFSLFFNGFWASSQYHLIAPDDSLDLTVDGDEYHGRCNAIFVGVITTTAQQATLNAYAQRFKVRIVYFEEARSADDVPMMTRLGLSQYNAGELLDIPMIKLTENAAPRVVNPALRTYPHTNNILTRGVIQTGSGVNGTPVVVAEYADHNGTSLTANINGIDYPSVAGITYEGNDGIEELHVFFGMTWFDLGSWGWAHYIFEWCTKGIFSGERRFLLGATVDDLFLSTQVFDYEEEYFLGDEYRMTDAELSTHLGVVTSLNAEFNAELVSEFAFNGNGILNYVGSSYVLRVTDPFAALLEKGELPTQNDDGTVGGADLLDSSWWTQSTVDALTAEFDGGQWDTDDLLFATIDHLDDFFWQSHTMVHLSRDDLSESDCDIEDGANARVAVIVGLFQHENYNWHSMTTPGITGLFNKNCLTSAWENLVTCAPGDNTYDGINWELSLVSSVSPYHSIYTTDEEVGFEGFQIMPRYSTNLYFNCQSTACLVLENLYIRRVVCGCTNPDPGTIDNLNLNTTDCDTTTACPLGLQALESVDNIFETEANTTARYIVSGRRDKYMFHQANVVPTTTPTGQKSLLDYWYEVVLSKMAEYINLKGTSPFPVRSIKSDHLCANFGEHEDLDGANATVTLTLSSNGTITGMALTAESPAGVIPVTVPTSLVDSVSLEGLPEGQPYAVEEYGSDTTFYIATSADDEPAEITTPSVSELAPVPT